jgi:hypothetical protein
MPGNSVTELWALYAIGVAFTVLRTYARVLAVGHKNFHADDYLIWLAIVSILPQCSNLVGIETD